MCLAVFKTCECGSKSVQFHLRDNLLQPEVVSRLFCPKCAGTQHFDEKNMLNDNGWVIEYDMLLAQGALLGRKTLSPEELSPAYLFDQGYCTWLETYPGEKEEIREERQAIIDLQKTDQQRYLQEMISWNVKRVQVLKGVGWRKAVLA